MGSSISPAGPKAANAMTSRFKISLAIEDLPDWLIDQIAASAMKSEHDPLDRLLDDDPGEWSSAAQKLLNGMRHDANDLG